ncbi:hypothetical protein DI396_03110 [Litorivita pollutaquae]|uniref:Sulfotransferase family protein n=1 Tax=Litorivita pollutaquae TaxID=2200892 RepID=A0A2V4NF92_9RHOB|nr:hypothetical protein [Litorivita pollutaquae]PYC49063.1 hypothetical protein DI396_03110 [Litorivita pollutaquae]
MRMVLHCGFHKTGTTSVQKMLDRDRALLAPQMQIALKAEIRAAALAARDWSATRNPAKMSAYIYDLALFFESLDPDDPRPLCLSCEDLCGFMPGRRHLTDYRAAAELLPALCEVIQEVLPASDITFYFSTRAPEPWVKSCYAQHLRASGLRDDFPTYRAQYLPHADLDADIARIAKAVAPHRVAWSALEDMTGRLGPLDPLLDLVAISTELRAKIAPLPPANTALDEDVKAALLEINRTQPPGQKRNKIKLDLVRAARKREQSTRR